jgi:heme/copper-type cytochrome/quinol oxidase subunit 1
MHGMIMLLLFATPLFVGFANVAVLHVACRMQRPAMDEPALG